MSSPEPDGSEKPLAGRILLLVGVVVIVLVLMFLQGTFKDIVG